MSIVANKIKGIRASLCHDVFSARYTREHNDANILTLGGRVIDTGLAKEIVKVWLNTDFSGEERHIKRLNKIKQEEDKIYK
jgi:ribose 5-phosphate isomerase B